MKCSITISLRGTVLCTLLSSLFMTISMFSTAQGTWSIVAPIPTAREWFGAATGFNGLIYAIGGDYDYRGIGGGTGFLTSVEAYDPIFNTWTEVAPLLSVQDDLAAAIGLDGKIYAMGGLDSSNLPVSTVESYDPATDSWSQEAPMLTARLNLAAATGSDGKIYAIGGLDNNYLPLSTVEAYDTNTNTWNSVASMPTARGGLAAAIGPDGKIYAIGGQDSYSSVNTVEAYDPSTNTWSTIAPIPNALTEIAAATGPDGKIYVFGGVNTSSGPGAVNTVEAYDTSKNTWTTVASMPTARRALGAATGPDGRIYAISGTIFISGGGTDTNTVEAYAPVSPVSLTLSPSSVIGSKPSIGKVMLSAPIQLSGMVVRLTSSNPGIVTVPSSITIAKGASTVSFTIRTQAVTSQKSVTVTATYAGVTKTAKLTVKPIGVKALVLSPDTVVSGDSATGLIVLDCPAAPGNITINLVSSNANVASVPASIIIPAGSSSGSFTITTTAGNSGSATISAKANGTTVTKTAVLTVDP